MNDSVRELKKRFIDYLMSMDFDKMDIQALSTYSYIVKTIDDMEKPGYAESLAMAFGGVNSIKNEGEGKGNG